MTLPQIQREGESINSNAMTKQSTIKILANKVRSSSYHVQHDPFVNISRYKHVHLYFFFKTLILIYCNTCFKYNFYTNCIVSHFPFFLDLSLSPTFLLHFLEKVFQRALWVYGVSVNGLLLIWVMEELIQEQRSLAETPTYSVASVVTVMVFVCFLVERSIYRFGKVSTKSYVVFTVWLLRKWVMKNRKDLSLKLFLGPTLSYLTCIKSSWGKIERKETLLFGVQMWKLIKVVLWTINLIL